MAICIQLQGDEPFKPGLEGVNDEGVMTTGGTTVREGYALNVLRQGTHWCGATVPDVKSTRAVDSVAVSELAIPETPADVLARRCSRSMHGQLQ